ncbi:MAG: 4Fe-4S dicluster domain-containing protein [SAR324 cluster bacterium]|nr:4Fe-4S dicluster domain-containing protein [SAR324 cluster bacterium]
MDQGLKRREFFKVIAAGGAATLAAAGCEQPAEQLIPLLVPPENIEYVPGNPVEYATTCMECSAGCGMVIQTREGRAIKAEGNPDHPVNQGALCIRGQASLQTLYNPSRLKSAMKRSGGSWQAADWDAVEKEVQDKISAISDKRQIVYMTGHAAGSRADFLDAWLAGLGASPKVVLEPLSQQNLRKANELTFFRNEVPLYQISKADYLLNFGAEFLETWLSPVSQNREYGAMHAVDEQTARRGKFVHVGPHVSLTGANADEWVGVNPGSERTVALALARQVLSKNKRNFRGREGDLIAQFLKPFTFERAEKESGVDRRNLAKIAKEFHAASASLALGGGNSTASESGTDTLIAVNLLNYVAGNMGKTVLFGASRAIEEATPYSEAVQVLRRMQAGEVKLLIVDGVNPAYAFPPSARAKEALAKVDTIVSLSSAWDETTAMAHLALPSQTFLERWGDAFPQKGAASLVQPVMAPVYPVKAAEDTLLSLARQLGLGQFAGTETYRDYLRDAWKAKQRAMGSSADFETFWHDALRNGGIYQQVSFSSSVRFNRAVLKRKPEGGKLKGDGLVLLPTVSLRHHDGRGASHPWLQEIPDPISQMVWDSWADINPDTAKKMGIRHGEQIKISSPYGTVETLAYYHYGVHRDAIAIPVGQGHTKSGRNADLVGVNVMELLPSAHDKASGQYAFLSTRVKVQGTGEQAFFAQLDGSPRQAGRGIIQTMTLDQFKKGEAPEPGHKKVGHGFRPTDFYKPREETPGYYDPYRWGMVVDTDRCTGCSACAAACYAENNLPVVGKERVFLGREMSWLRLDRFLEGEGDSYKTLMQPMFCQQCGNAGCEPVCPVYATYHTPDGLNAQVYNRCVGTRYCSNNCVYKVRRFNWFTYEFESPLNLQLNPDVTVRTKGIMEKCTFCIQRIKRARDTAGDEGRLVADGEITPACVQTCPTKALTFGNLSDQNSQVSRKSRRGEGEKQERLRQYEVLEELANLPAVTYLRKVVLEDLNKEA